MEPSRTKSNLKKSPRLSRDRFPNYRPRPSIRVVQTVGDASLPHPTKTSKAAVTCRNLRKAADAKIGAFEITLLVKPGGANAPPHPTTGEVT